MYTNYQSSNVKLGRAVKADFTAMSRQELAAWPPRQRLRILLLAAKAHYAAFDFAASAEY
jgi:DNA-binding IclR family transcriptional regulator